MCVHLVRVREQGNEVIWAEFIAEKQGPILTASNWPLYQKIYI